MEFVFVSGRPSLDFVGTRKWRRRAEPEDQLGDQPALARWSLAAGLLDGAPRVDATAFARAIDLREAIYRTLDAVRLGHSLRRSDVGRLNACAAGPPVTRRLALGGSVRTTGNVDQLLRSLAEDAFELLADDDARARLRECANPDCTRLYVDTSRGMSRRWCGMAECGNRAKVARYRARHPSSGG